MEKNAHLRNWTFYRGKRVFVTGHTGYKGSWLTAMLYEMGAEATGYALAPPAGGLFEQMRGWEMIHSVTGDVADRQALETALLAAQPEIVFHLAALVTECFAEPHRAYESNVMGTVDLLEAVRKCPSVRSVVIVTTDKVYANKGDGAIYKETDPLGGVDPYDASKTCMEYVTDSYKRAYLQVGGRMVGVSTVRASNVLGGGDHVKTRLIPTILDAVAQGRPVQLRHPDQTRPWQSMLDALNGYLAIGRLMYEEPERYSSQWNIGPTQDGIRSVLWVVEQMRKHYASAQYVADGARTRPESETLGLDISKSLALLDWEPRLSCDEMFYNVVDFFKKQQAGVDTRDICAEQIRAFFGPGAVRTEERKEQTDGIVHIVPDGDMRGGMCSPCTIDCFSAGDIRGGFTKCYEKTALQESGVSFEVTEAFFSRSAKNVIRGLHFQLHDPQAKIVCVPHGRIYDVVVDLRPESPAFKKWYAVELSGENHKAVYVPRGFAHGFASLEDDTVVMYYCEGAYDKASDTGIRFDDPDIGVQWPVDPAAAIHSERDLSLMSLAEYMRDPMR